MTRYEDHLDDMPAEGYAHSAISLGRTESFQALYFGHIANYQSRGVFNAPEQLSLYGDGVRGKYFADSFRAQVGSTEVDVDLCVPSTMLPAIMGRWMFLFIERDRDTIALFRAAPRRFFRPSTSSAAISLLHAPTRYGHVSAVLSVLPVGEQQPECSQYALLKVTLQLHGRGYVDKHGGLTLEARLRGHGEACVLPHTLASASVVGEPVGEYTIDIDQHSETIKVHFLSAQHKGTQAFVINATFA